MSGADLAVATLRLLYFNSVVKITELEFDLFYVILRWGWGGGGDCSKVIYYFINTCGRLGCFMYVNILVVSVFIFN
jgi:hypothetical protein